MGMASMDHSSGYDGFSMAAFVVLMGLAVGVVVGLYIFVYYGYLRDEIKRNKEKAS